MTRTAQNGQEPADVRSEEADVAGIFTQNLFSDLEQAVQTTGGLQSSRTANHGQNREDHVDRGFARFQAKAENQDDQAHATQKAEGHTTFAGTIEQACQH